MVGPGFLTSTTAAGLPDLDRYLQALAVRAERIGQNPDRDRERMAEVLDVATALETAVAALRPERRAGPGRPGGAPDARGVPRRPVRPADAHSDPGVGQADPRRGGGAAALRAQPAGAPRLEPVSPGSGPAAPGQQAGRAAGSAGGAALSPASLSTRPLAFSSIGSTLSWPILPPDEVAGLLDAALDLVRVLADHALGLVREFVEVDHRVPPRWLPGDRSAVADRARERSVQSLDQALDPDQVTLVVDQEFPVAERARVVDPGALVGQLGCGAVVFGRFHGQRGRCTSAVMPDTLVTSLYRPVRMIGRQAENTEPRR